MEPEDGPATVTTTTTATQTVMPQEFKVPPYLEYTAVGLLVAMAIAFVAIGLLAYRRKSGGDGEFQTQQLRQVADLNTQLEKSADRNKDLNTTNDKLTQDLIGLARSHSTEMVTVMRENMASINIMRAEHSQYALKQDDQMKEVYKTLDKTNIALAQCETRDTQRVHMETTINDRFQQMEHTLDTIGRLVGAKITLADQGERTTVIGSVRATP